MRWLAAHTSLPALGIWLLIIGVCVHYKWPFDLLSKTDVNYIDRDSIFGVTILDEGQERAKTIRYTVREEEGSCFYLYLQKDSLPFPKMGDQMVVQTTVHRGDTLGSFDYGLYLRRQGIVGTAWAHRGNWMIVRNVPIKGIIAYAQRWQKKLINRYRQMGIDGAELGVLGAMTLGYREELSPEVREYFTRSGASHILAVSGLHTGIIWYLIMLCLTMGGKIKPRWENRLARWIILIISLMTLWTYAAITGFSPSVVRSAIMLTILEGSFLIKRQQDSIQVVGAAALIILLINPLDIWNLSFQLSFAAVIPLIVLIPRWQERINISNSTLRMVVELILVSVAAQLGTLPLTLHYFGQTCTYFILTNIILIPLAGIVIPLGQLALAFSFCPLGGMIATLADWGTRLIIESAQWVESFPGAILHISLNWIGVGFLYAAIVMGVMMMRGKKVHWGWLIGVIASGIGLVVYG